MQEDYYLKDKAVFATALDTVIEFSIATNFSTYNVTCYIPFFYNFTLLRLGKNVNRIYDITITVIVYVRSRKAYTKSRSISDIKSVNTTVTGKFIFYIDANEINLDYGQNTEAYISYKIIFKEDISDVEDDPKTELEKTAFTVGIISKTKIRRNPIYAIMLVFLGVLIITLPLLAIEFFKKRRRVNLPQKIFKKYL